MPFTLSHAAAALPFRRTRLVMSALVFGCFAPDLEYSVAATQDISVIPSRVCSFSIYPLPWLRFSFFTVMRNGPSSVAPFMRRERLRNGSSLSTSSVLRGFALICVLVGAVTHLIRTCAHRLRLLARAAFGFLRTGTRMCRFSHSDHGPDCSIHQFCAWACGGFWCGLFSGTEIHRQCMCKQIKQLSLAIASLSRAHSLRYLAGLVRAAISGSARWSSWRAAL